MLETWHLVIEYIYYILLICLAASSNAIVVPISSRMFSKNSLNLLYKFLKIFVLYWASELTKRLCSSEVVIPHLAEAACYLMTFADFAPHNVFFRLCTGSFLFHLNHTQHLFLCTFCLLIIDEELCFPLWFKEILHNIRCTFHSLSILFIILYLAALMFSLPCMLLAHFC